MENLIFSLDATIPIFLVMVLGMFLRKLGLLEEKVNSALNRLVFKVFLPVLLFNDLSQQDFASAWNGKFVLFCALVTLASIALAALMSRLVCHSRPERGEFIHVSYRSSAAILGMAFIQNIYGEGNTGMAPLMILGSVPLYNAFAVLVLLLTAEDKEEEKGAGADAERERTAGTGGNEADSPQHGGRRKRSGHPLLARTLKGIVTNPIIIGIAVGLIWSVLAIPQPQIMQSTLHYIGQLATPLGLLAMGASFEFRKAKGELKPSIAAAFNKLILFCGLFLPLAVRLGFRGQEIVALLVMMGSATTVTSYIMARNMGHEGTLTSNTVMITTLGCSVTLTFWLWLVKTLGVI